MSSETPAAQASPAEPSPEPIMQLGMAFWASKALLSAIELGVFHHARVIGIK